MYTADELEQASRIVYAAMPPTPQFAWPLLGEATGCEAWVKHENHTPTGAFKVRGGLVHMKMRKDRGETGGVITATRGRARSAVLAYSPGHRGWHVSGQRALFAALSPEEIGITLNSSCLMQPLKSVSGVLVAGHPDVHDFDDDFPFCSECSTRDCRVKKNCAGPGGLMAPFLSRVTSGPHHRRRRRVGHLVDGTRPARPGLPRVRRPPPPGSHRGDRRRATSPPAPRS